jgi:hypothetical protein
LAERREEMGQVRCNTVDVREGGLRRGWKHTATEFMSRHHTDFDRPIDRRVLHRADSRGAQTDRIGGMLKPGGGRTQRES